MTYQARQYKRPIFGFSETHLINLKITKINQVRAFAYEAYMSLRKLLFYYDSNKIYNNTCNKYFTEANKWIKLWHLARAEYDPEDTEVIITIDGISKWMDEHPKEDTDRIYYTYGDYKWIIERSKSFLPRDLTELLKVPDQISTQPAQSFWQQLEQERRLRRMLNSTTRLEQP